MSEAISHAEARHAAEAHHEVGFVRHYIFSGYGGAANATRLARDVLSRVPR